jgi:hypothetical protein
MNKNIGLEIIDYKIKKYKAKLYHYNKLKDAHMHGGRERSKFKIGDVAVINGNSPAALAYNGISESDIGKKVKIEDIIYNGQELDYYVVSGLGDKLKNVTEYILSKVSIVENKQTHTTQASHETYNHMPNNFEN